MEITDSEYSNVKRIKRIQVCTYSIRSSNRNPIDDILVLDSRAVDSWIRCYKTPMGKINKLIRDITNELEKAFALSTSGFEARSLEQTTRAPPSNPVQSYRAEGSTMEVFLGDIEMHKTIRFTAEQLQFFTANFSTVLGSGGFGVVYKGIAYMHEECPERIIHYDIKPGNILLDANFCPKIADFGLAKLRSREDTHDSISGYRGTPGYSAPELFHLNYRITQKCDVYSFGMLLFEIVGRKRNADVASSRTSMNWFPKHVWEGYEEGELSITVMACGIEEKDREKAERMCMVALWCVQDSPDARPPMSAIVKMLEDGVEVVPPPKPFSYFNSMAVNLLMASNESSGVSSSSSYSTSEGNSSTWFRETKPLMPKNGTSRGPS
ncbi:Protein kinase domain [Dillenia turbinata]|uniref:Protein kinase domain n=1 Tax=Dillenia turbinata TaxID=194707 RepID=A0AAN8V1J1_9MAGN